jgi:hypothetical protein
LRILNTNSKIKTGRINSKNKTQITFKIIIARLKVSIGLKPFAQRHFNNPRLKPGVIEHSLLVGFSPFYSSYDLAFFKPQINSYDIR